MAQMASISTICWGMYNSTKKCHSMCRFRHAFVSASPVSCIRLILLEACGKTCLLYILLTCNLRSCRPSSEILLPYGCLRCDLDDHESIARVELSDIAESILRGVRRQKKLVGSIPYFIPRSRYRPRLCSSPFKTESRRSFHVLLTRSPLIKDLLMGYG